MDDLQERIKQCEEKFEQVKAQQQELATELIKLQGEWRLLQELVGKDDPVLPPDAETITVEPEAATEEAKN